VYPNENNNTYSTTGISYTVTTLPTIQWNLDLSFFKGVEKTNDEHGETINPENHFFLNKKSRTLSFASWQNFASIENDFSRTKMC
jgi:hypothetical protein